MTKAAAIMGSMTDVRNGALESKAVRVTIEVPAEHAASLFALFGWPTKAEPVAVAIARLNTASESRPGPPASEDAGASEPSTPPASTKRKWDDFPPSQQAAIRCGTPEFMRFVHVSDEHGAAQFVRQRCRVQSRSDLDVDDDAAERWRTLDAEYWAWQHDPRRAE